MKVKSLSRVQLLATPWTAAYQAPPSMGFSRQEYWSGLPLPSLGFQVRVQLTNIESLKTLGMSFLSWGCLEPGLYCSGSELFDMPHPVPAA